MNSEIRIGIGRDLHRLVEGRRFVLGGVQIPFERGEAGHSDGDVLSHAIIDALFGAAGLGDIGEHFPSNAEFKDARSLDMLGKAASMMRLAGWEIVNIDAIVECERPKLLEFREAVRASLANALGIAKEKIFVKGKTGEGLGDIGEGRAIAASAAALLKKND